MFLKNRSRDFEAIYESLIVNYSSSSRDDSQYQKPSILYVLPNNIGDLFGTIETLMEWKKRVGYEVNYVSSSNIVNNRNNLKEYIEEAYQYWENPPVFVTIVGDASGNYDMGHGMKIGVAIMVIQIIHIPPWKEAINFLSYLLEGFHFQQVLIYKQL